MRVIRKRCIFVIVRQNIYDSVTDRNVWTPQGSKVIGQVEGLKEKDIHLTFSLMIFLNGHSVKLPDVNGVSDLDESGLGDTYAHHT